MFHVGGMRYFTERLTIFVFFGCATSPEPVRVDVPPPPQLPPVLPHPASLSASDLDWILKDPRVEAIEDKTPSCDASIRLLKEKTSSREEQSEGVRELIRKQPETLHFCFYLRLRDLSGKVRGTGDTESRQKLFLEQFETLTPLARGFLEAHQDSRYLRRLVKFYESWAPVLLYRKVELTPQGTALLVLPTEGPSRPLSSDEASHPRSVLERYSLDEDRVVEAPVSIEAVKPPAEPSDTELKEILK